MELMRKIVFTACFLGIAMSISDMLKPSEKFNKQVRLIFSLMFVIGLAAPFLSGGVSFSIDDIIPVEKTANYSELEETVDANLKASVEHNLSRAILLGLSEEGIECGEISVSVNIEDNSGISINEVTVSSCESFEKAETVIKSQLGFETAVKRAE